jgi:A/G-specific adenine glycosylase
MAQPSTRTELFAPSPLLSLNDQEQVEAFQQAMLLWFAKHERSFPWRRSDNPYFILVAEKLLQQTVARESVVAAWHQITTLYPSPRHLAQADVAVLETFIRPLGFIYRAQELPTLGAALVKQHNGEIPNTLAELLALPGVGDYAARAVLSFGFGQDAAIVDVNVARFLYRIFRVNQPLPANPARKRPIQVVAQRLLPAGKSKSFNLAVLDVSALICTARNPKCRLCPVRKFCLSADLFDAKPPAIQTPFENEH